MMRSVHVMHPLSQLEDLSFITVVVVTDTHMSKIDLAHVVLLRCAALSNSWTRNESTLSNEYILPCYRYMCKLFMHKLRSMGSK
mmetsp:Transcript_12177/g.17861  ORF Transcript_12177/g.17861 Transcript_12177/m.17861 type:complete len:84 (-) Transcript_12177:454-705(-)